ncbi:hypothetical protein D3C83_175200 [compost metagenome]
MLRRMRGCGIRRLAVEAAWSLDTDGRPAQLVGPQEIFVGIVGDVDEALIARESILYELERGGVRL